jgi:4-phospho-D-threonate 3-dehydrogenase / 4-phospho-D-erythronate 3-dehydrogenase
MSNKPVLAITMGDPASVGPEITLKSFTMDNFWERGVPVVCGDLAVMEGVKKTLDIPVSIVAVTDAAQAAALPATTEGLPTVPVLDQKVVTDLSALEVGKVSALAGNAAVAYIQAAVDLCTSGAAAGIATAPINKEALREAKQHYIGHTEMISEMSNGKKGITMFQVDKMKIFFHSRHVSLAKAIEMIRTDDLLDSIEVARNCLASVDIHNPKLAVAGLNPHSSDGGLFGDEEAREITPAITAAVAKGMNVVGPVPADSVFHHAAEGRYDAVLSLYHDQGHIASKCYDFYRVVSVTFGYPFIRTSVDHGTALDIAWKGIANPVSMREAVIAGFELAPRYKPIYSM